MIRSKDAKFEPVDLGLIFKIAIVVTLLSTFRLSSLLAEEHPAATPVNELQQPTTQATALPESNPGSVTETASLTQDSTTFLIGESPLTRPAADSDIRPESSVTPQPGITPENIAIDSQIPVGLKPFAENPEDVAMLVSENCGKSGNDSGGTISCDRVYSNGHHATVLTQRAAEGDESKQQTVIEEYDSMGDLLYRKTIRHRLDYNYLNDQKVKEKELFDIIYQPAGKKTTRELMVYEYFLDSGKTRSLSWTQYKQIGDEPKAGLVYHTLLRYADDGSPDRGLAERWDGGTKRETFMNWSRRSKGYATLDEEAWNQWEGWIRSIAMQAYLP